MGISMGRRSASVEKFLKSLDAYMENEANKAHARIYSDELFIFSESGVSRRRRSRDDHIILADRRRGASFSGRSVSEAFGLTRSELKAFYAALDSKRKFAVIPVAGKAAILYLGLFRSCRIGVMSLTPHLLGADSADYRDDFRYVFDDTFFPKELIKIGSEGNFLSFINDFMLFKSDILLACGIESRDGTVKVREMLYSAAELVGCELSLAREGGISASRIERDTTAAMVLCILSAVRSVSEDRCAYVGVSERDGESVISVSFKPYGDFDGENAAFVAFCRSFSELHGISFSFVKRGERYCASFIPERIDPSQSGLKASVIFDFNPHESR